MNTITLKNVTKKYGKKTLAMNAVDLEVPEAGVFALLGENGAGKTTMIRTLLGLEVPDTGEVQVLDLDPQRDGVEIRRRVGYVSDTPALYDWMTVAEIGWFTAGFYPTGYQAAYESLCQQFELPLDRKIKQLSKGGKAKVALGLSMAHRPELLILDEPTSGLDTLVRRKFLESMVDVAAEGRTVFLSSHQIPEVERVADYVAIMNEGQILVCDRLDELKQKLERWVVTVDAPDAPLPEFEATVLSHEGVGKRRQQLVVQEPGPQALWQLRDDVRISEVEVHIPTLEEIFVVYMSAAPNEGQHQSASSRTLHSGGQHE